MLDISSRKEKVGRIVFALAIVLFLVGIYASVSAEPGLLSDLSILPAAAIVILIMPLNLCLNGREFQLSVRLFRKDIPFRNALQTTVLGSAANMLPLPGAAMVKIAHMKTLGVGIASGAAVTVVLGLVWMGASAVYSGLWLITVVSTTLWPCLLVVSGFAVIALSIAAVYRLHGNLRVLLEILAVRLGLTIIDSCALYLCFQAINNSGSFAQASVLSLSSFLGAAVSIVPAGFGIREFAAAGLGELLSMNIAVTYMAAALYRVLGLLAIFPLAFSFMRKPASSG